jgi:hypothetical protein
MFREAFTIDQAKEHCRDAKLHALSFASLGSGGCIGLQGVLRTRRWMPRWGAENVAVKRQMWGAVTAALSFADVLLIKVVLALWCHMIEATMPCIDYSSSGHHKGEWGDTGWLWVYAIRLAMAIGPTVIFSEMADHAMLVNGGETIKRILAALRVNYHVVMRIVKVWDYGDGIRRRRLIIVALRKDSVGAQDYEMPAPVFTHVNPHTARDTAVADAEVPDDHWLKQPLIKLYNWAAPVAGELHRIGRVGMNMGPSWNPSLVFTFDGTNNGPTTFGGEALNLHCSGSGVILCRSDA